MFKLVFTLLKLNIHSMLYSMFTFLGVKNKESKSRNGVVHVIIICAVILFLIVMFFFFFTSFLGLAMITRYAAVWSLYPSVAFLGAMGFSFLGTVLSSQSYLFEAQDNEHLLSMPIKPVHILISRFATLYSLNLLYSWLVLLPSFVVFIVVSGRNIIGVFLYLLFMLIFPLAITALCSIFGYLFYIISSKFPDKKTGNVIVGVTFFTLIVFSIMQLKPYAEKAFGDFKYALELMKEIFYPFYMVSESVVEYNLISFIVFAAVSVLLSVGICLLISKRYVKILTTHREKPKAVYVEKPAKVHSPFSALLIKEIKYFFSSPGYVLNTSLGTVFSVIFGIYLINNGYEFSGTVSEYVTNVNSLVPLVILSSLTLMSVMNDATAPSISLEAKTLWMLKTMPVDCVKILLAKTVLSPIITVPSVIIMTVCSVNAVEMSFIDVLAMLIIPMVASFFSGLLGVCVNLIFPRFDWTSEIIVIKQSASVIITLISAVFLAAFPFVFAILLPALLDDFAIYWSYIMIFGYFFVLCILAVVFLNTKGRKLFQEL